MKDVTRIGYFLKNEGVPWHHDPSEYRKISQIPPVPPWIERTKKVSAWSAWTWNPWIIPSVVSSLLGVFLLPLAAFSGLGLLKWILFLFALLIVCAPLLYTMVRIKNGTALYETHTEYGDRYFIEVESIGDDDMRARVVAVDKPVRIEL